MERSVLVPDWVFDSVAGVMLEDHAIVIEGDRIDQVVRSSEVPRGEPVVDLTGHSLLPGLIDVHTHLATPLDDGQGFAQLVQRNAAQDALIQAAREILDDGTHEFWARSIRSMGTVNRALQQD